jgi:hypothetical protein
MTARSAHAARLLTVGAVALALLVPATADAARPKAGKWSGTVESGSTEVTFRVSKSRKRVKNFAVVQLQVYCFGSGLTTKVFLVPSAKIKKHGKFKTVFSPKNDAGQDDGNFELSGRFKTRKKASGKLKYTRSGCYSGERSWSAKKK